MAGQDSPGPSSSQPAMASPLETQTPVGLTPRDPQTPWPLQQLAGTVPVPPIGSTSLTDTPWLPGHFTCLPAGPAGSLLVLTPSSARPHSLHHGHVGPCDLALRPPYTPPYPTPKQRVPHPGKELEIEFNNKRGQTVLIKGRARLDTCAGQPTVYVQLSLFSPHPSLSPL